MTEENIRDIRSVLVLLRKDLMVLNNRLIALDGLFKNLQQDLEKQNVEHTLTEG